MPASHNGRGERIPMDQKTGRRYGPASQDPPFPSWGRCGGRAKDGATGDETMGHQRGRKGQRVPCTREGDGLSLAAGGRDAFET